MAPTSSSVFTKTNLGSLGGWRSSCTRVNCVCRKHAHTDTCEHTYTHIKLFTHTHTQAQTSFSWGLSPFLLLFNELCHLHEMKHVQWHQCVPVILNSISQTKKNSEDFIFSHATIVTTTAKKFLTTTVCVCEIEEHSQLYAVDANWHYTHACHITR